MEKPVLVASAKPKEHKVRVNHRTYTYANIRQQEFVAKDEVMQWIGNIAKTTLRRVRRICQQKNGGKNGSNLHK